MDIRTRFVFTLVSVSLVSMLLFGVVMYRSVQGELLDHTFGQLDGLAEFKDSAVRGLVAGWHDRVSLVASRTQLRASLAENDRSRSPAAEATIQRILGDAVSASPLFRRLEVTDRDGRLVASAGDGMDPFPSEGGAAERTVAEGSAAEGAAQESTAPGSGDANAPGQATRYEGVTFVPDSLPVVRFSAPLVYEADTVGTLHATLSTREIADLTASRVGMGQTGETIVAVLDAGVPRVLHPVRSSEDGAAGLVVANDSTVQRALARGENRFSEGVLDYRGELVWASTRRIDETGWALVVKVDADEQRAPVDAFRQRMVRLAGSLAAIAILFGTVLGLRFAQPLLRLADMASEIGAGNLGARSGVKREDEVGLLARTFDGMAADLEEQVTLLSEFRRFFNVSIDLMCIASVDGFFKRVNPAFVEELGWSEEELLGRPFVSLVHADDIEATVRQVERLASGTPAIEFSNRFRRADGSYALLLWNSYPDEETGKLYAIARVQQASPETPR